MPENQYIEIECVEVKQPIGSFFVASIRASDLIHISYTDVRALRNRDLDQYLGIERELVPGRVKEISKYVGLVDATFPTSVILAVSTSDGGDHGEEEYTIRHFPDRRVLRIKRDKGIAKIIDGQHRIAGLMESMPKEFWMNVTIFVDMDIEDQAMVFATINLKQAKVSKSLQYDLFELAKSRSPQKTSHNIARLLNRKDGSPFFGKIKVLGKAEGALETITQASFVDRLLPYVSKDPMNDRDLLKRGKPVERAVGLEIDKLIFRNLFIDEKDEIISKIIWNYFSAVGKKWPRSWNELRPGHILNRTTGFSALMQVLRPSYLKLRHKDGSIVDESGFATLLADVNLSDDSFTSTEYNPGSSGISVLRQRLMNLTGLG